MRGRGLEPPQVTLLVPKTNASTNFATHAHYLLFINNSIQINSEAVHYLFPRLPRLPISPADTDGGDYSIK